MKCSYSHKTYASVLSHMLLVSSKVHEEAESDRQIQRSVICRFDMKHMVCSQAQKASYKVKASTANYKTRIAHKNYYWELLFESYCVCLHDLLRTFFITFMLWVLLFSKSILISFQKLSSKEITVLLYIWGEYMKVNIT